MSRNEMNQKQQEGRIPEVFAIYDEGFLHENVFGDVKAIAATKKYK